MPQPIFTGTPLVCQFGGKALPVVGTTLTYINLNDVKNWFLQLEPGLDNSSRVIGLAPYLYRAKGIYLSDDYGSRTITLPQRFYEGADFGGSATPLGTVLSKITQAGEQFLTFDNLTAIPVKYRAISGRKLLRGYPPLWWDLNLEFISSAPWFMDLAATTAGPTALAGSVAPGTATNINYNYPGSVFAEPVFTFTIPAGNGVTITQFALKNNTSGETLTLAFNPVLPASTAKTLTIDCAAFTVKDGAGVNYDVIGSFPMLYPPAGQVNAYTATLTTGSGTSTGVTLSISYNARWEI